MTKRICILGLLVASLVLLFECQKTSHKDGVFLGEADFERFTEDYSRSEKEAEVVLLEYCENTGEKWWYIPYKIVFATEGGYLFLDGEFKINIQADGYFVDRDGKVSWRSLGWAMSVEDYLERVEVER